MALGMRHALAAGIGERGTHMASAAQGTQSVTVKPKFIAQWMVVIAVLGIGYFAASRVIDAGNRVLSGPATSDEAVLAHCAQFVALAKSRYGDDWKFRLDPRDTVCANKVQQEWEAQILTRAQPAAPDTQPNFVERATEIQTREDTAPSINASRARNPETYCLNLMSLSRTKYGEHWRTQVSAVEAAGCEEVFAKTAAE